MKNQTRTNVVCIALIKTDLLKFPICLSELILSDTDFSCWTAHTCQSLDVKNPTIHNFLNYHTISVLIESNALHRRSKLIYAICVCTVSVGDFVRKGKVSDLLKCLSDRAIVFVNYTNCLA